MRKRSTNRSSPNISSQPSIKNVYANGSFIASSCSRLPYDRPIDVYHSFFWFFFSFFIWFILLRGEEKPAGTSIDLDFFLCYLRDHTSIRFLSEWVVLICSEVENDANTSTTVNIILSYFSTSMEWIPEQASVHLQLLFHHFQERVFVLSKIRANGIR